jgi:lysosomal alpha-mannosidase
MNSGLHLYFPLPGLCWDAINCNDPVVQDNAALEDYNVDDVVSRAIFQFREQAGNYIGGDVWFTAGFDFNFEFAEEWFINLDKMIHYINLVRGVRGGVCTRLRQLPSR